MPTPFSKKIFRNFFHLKFVYMDSFMYLCEMKSIILFFLLASTQLFGQSILLTPRDSRMDSIASFNVRSCLTVPSYSNGVKSLVVSKYVRFTLKTFINMDMVSKIEDGDDMDLQDYAGMGRFDIRMKVYTSANTRLVSRMIASGVNAQGYSYSCGFIIKF